LNLHQFHLQTVEHVDSYHPINHIRHSLEKPSANTNNNQHKCVAFITAIIQLSGSGNAPQTGVGMILVETHGVMHQWHPTKGRTDGFSHYRVLLMGKLSCLFLPRWIWEINGWQHLYFSYLYCH